MINTAKIIKNLFFLSPLILIVLACSCSSAQSPLPSYLIWEKDQTGKIEADFLQQIIFDHFIFQNGYLSSTAEQARLILWSKTAQKKRVAIRYLCSKPVKVIFNNDRFSTFIINPCSKYNEQIFTVNFQAGANFILFENHQQSLLRISKIAVNNEDKFQNLLSATDTVSFFSSRQEVQISLSGKGEVEINRFFFVNDDISQTTQKINLNLLKQSKQVRISTSEAELVRIQAVKGKIKISRLNTQPLKREKAKSSLQKIQPENIFIFLIDACQAKHLSAYGYERKTSPHIDELSKDAVLFENAFSTASFTRSSVASIFSGLFPDNHGVRIMSEGLSEKLFLLPEFLKPKGFRTAIFSAAATVSKEFGFFQGIDHYQSAFGQWKEFDQRKKFPFLIKNWLEPAKKNFAYVHFLEPHLPIIPPPPFLDIYGKPEDSNNRMISRISELQKKGYKFSEHEVQEIINDYDSTINYIDNELGTILKYLKQTGLYDKSLIIFTSDHGEALYEHQTFGHGYNVYPETIHVPLIIKFPAAMKLQNRRVQDFVQIHSIYATICDLFGEKIITDGTSLLNFIDKKNPGACLIIARSFTKQAIFNIGFKNWFLIHFQNNSRNDELYFDSFSQNRIKERREIALFLKSYYFFWNYLNQQKKRFGSGIVNLKTLPQEQIENLRSLGYIN